MKRLIPLLAIFLIGCQTNAQYWTLTGSVYVESERPEGRAVAKMEVRYTPPGNPYPKEAPPPRTDGSPDRSEVKSGI